MASRAGTNARFATVGTSLIILKVDADMAGTLHAELTEDGKQIVLMGVGDSWEQKRLGEVLSLITPALKKADPPVAVFVPCTWPTVVQLEYTFTRDPSVSDPGNGWWVPGPRLTEWIIAEHARRRERDDPLPLDLPAGCVPRDYQVDGARSIAYSGRFLVLDDPGVGKAQPETTPIWTPSGWNELGNLVPGDLVYNRYGQPVPIRKVHYQGEKPVWKITFSDRTSTLASSEHLWRVWTKNDRNHPERRFLHEHGRIMTTDQLREAGLLYAGDNAAKFFLPQQPVLTGWAEDLPLDSYAYGALLGDGSLGGSGLSITCPDREILSRVAEAAAELGTTHRWNTPPARCQNLVFHRNGKLRAVLSELGACVRSAGKSIHPRYLHATEHHRRELLAGLLDTDGGVSGNCVEFNSASLQLAADTAWISRSLGAVVTEASPRPAGYRDKTGTYVRCEDSYRLTIRFPANGPNPFRVPRKADAWTAMAAKLQRRNPPRAFSSIEPAGTVPVCCIELDTDDPYARVYLTDTTLIPTHNTVTTILGLAWRQHLGHDIFPAVVVVPSWGVARAWEREIRKWIPGWTTATWTGPKRAELAGAADVYLVTYATARRDAADTKGPLVKLKTKTVVADEVHWIGNPKAQQTKAVQRIASKVTTFAGLSGTVIRTDVRDLWPPLKAMDKASWPSGERLTERYCIKGHPDYGSAIEGLEPLREPEFRDTLLGAMRRVAKADVLTQLPPKIYSVRRIAMPDDWRKAYDDMETDMLAELPDGQQLPAFDVLTRMNHLSQMASSAFDVKVTEGPDVDEITGQLKKHYHVILREPCWKADELMEIMEERRGSAPIVAFAPSKQLMMLAGLRAAKQGYRVGYYVGLGRHPDHADWPAISEKSRQRDFDAFQAGQLDLLCVTTKAGGTGLTLTAAGTAVFLRRPWELDDAIQAEDRCLTAGTPVLTESGWVSVEDICIGDTVVTHTGESQPVTDVWSRLAPHSRIMTEIRITGQPDALICTADHPFLLKSGQWCDAGDLKPGNWLAMPSNDVTDELIWLPFGDAHIADTFLNNWGSEQTNGRLIHAPETIQVTDDFLYTLGYYAGDGFASTSDSKGRFISFSGNQDTKAAAMNRCKRWATGIGLHGACQNQPAPARGAEYRFYSAEWAYWFSGAFGHGARNKHLPNFMLQLNERQSRIILDGLSASDGYLRDGRPRCEYSTMSARLAANVLQLATRAGYRPSLTRGSTGQYLIAFGGEPGPRSAGRVRSVLLRYPERREVLYDITVKNTETFIAGGVVVHNCHRIGSEIHAHGVEIIDVRTIKSVETRVVERLREKGANLAELVQDPRIARELMRGS